METVAFADDEFINYRAARALAEGFLRTYIDDATVHDLSIEDLVGTFLGYIEDGDRDEAY